MARNVAPEEFDLPFRLTGELAMAAIIGIAWVLAWLLSSVFSFVMTMVVLVIIGVIALLIQQWHLYAVRFASFRVYRAATVREVEPRQPKP